MRQVPQARPISLALILFVCMGLAWVRPARAQALGRELSLEEYIAQLHSATQALDGQDRRATHTFRLALPSEWTVRVDGQVMKVKTDWLGTALYIEDNAPTASTDRIQQALLRLTALREAAETLATQSGGANLNRSRARIDRILSDREFQGSHEPSWLDKLKARIYGWLERQWNKMFGHLGISPAASNILAWVLVGIAGLLLAFWAVRALLYASSREEMDLSGAAPAGQDWRYWAAKARTAAASRDYRAAIHAAYWAAVARLEENRLLPEDRSRTPRESLRLVRQDSAAYPPLLQLTRRFELTWYGYRGATSADWDGAAEQLETLGCLRSSTPATAGSLPAR